jgi:hypothetical protein
MALQQFFFIGVTTYYEQHTRHAGGERACSEITFLLYAGVGGDLTFVLRVGNREVALEGCGLRYHPPVLLSCEPAAVMPGDRFRIKGSHFGPDGTRVAVTLSTSSTVIKPTAVCSGHVEAVCTLPGDAVPGVYSVQVAVGGQQSTCHEGARAVQLVVQAKRARPSQQQWTPAVGYAPPPQLVQQQAEAAMRAARQQQREATCIQQLQNMQSASAAKARDQAVIDAARNAEAAQEPRRQPSVEYSTASGSAERPGMSRTHRQLVALQAPPAARASSLTGAPAPQRVTQPPAAISKPPRHGTASRVRAPSSSNPHRQATQPQLQQQQPRQRAVLPSVRGALHQTSAGMLPLPAIIPEGHGQTMSPLGVHHLQSMSAATGGAQGSAAVLPARPASGAGFPTSLQEPATEGVLEGGRSVRRRLSTDTDAANYE